MHWFLNSFSILLLFLMYTYIIYGKNIPFEICLEFLFTFQIQYFVICHVSFLNKIISKNIIFRSITHTHVLDCIMYIYTERKSFTIEFIVMQLVSCTNLY